ncbi:MAG: RluA family pseudouridine synthase [Bryobacterales bacterium]|nr:RluA family pseudouridine synthase [Bryobacterales bacterium]
MALRLFYEDEHLAVVEKPSGVLVHPTPMSRQKTFLDELRQYFGSTDALSSPRASGARLVHRLDRGTSGIMIVARTPAAEAKLQDSFRDRTIKKGYIALVFGSTPKTFEVHEPIGEVQGHPGKWDVVANGKQSHTFFETAWSSNDFSLLRVKPISGRTHQIRIHTTWQGFPIVGDPWYPGTYVPVTPWQRYLFDSAKRLCLHAYHIEFVHPILGARMKFWCPPPDSFLDIVRTISTAPVEGGISDASRA